MDLAALRASMISLCSYGAKAEALCQRRLAIEDYTVLISMRITRIVRRLYVVFLSDYVPSPVTSFRVVGE